MAHLLQRYIFRLSFSAVRRDFKTRKLQVLMRVSLVCMTLMCLVTGAGRGMVGLRVSWRYMKWSYRMCRGSAGGSSWVSRRMWTSLERTSMHHVWRRGQLCTSNGSNNSGASSRCYNLREIKQGKPRVLRTVWAGADLWFLTVQTDHKWHYLWTQQLTAITFCQTTISFQLQSVTASQWYQLIMLGE